MYSQSISFVFVVLIPSREDYAVASLVLVPVDARENAGVHGSVVQEQPVWFAHDASFRSRSASMAREGPLVAMK